MRQSRCVLFDWGNTLMRDFPDAEGPMADWPRVETLPGVEEVLPQLRPHWTLALATNAVASDELSVWRALDRGGIAHLLDKVYCFQTIGHKKPAPGFFDHIVKDLAMHRDRIIMVGDDFENDILGAIRSGIRSIWLNPSSDEVRVGDLSQTIHDLRSLPEVLSTLAPQPDA